MINRIRRATWLRLSLLDRWLLKELLGPLLFFIVLFTLLLLTGGVMFELIRKIVDKNQAKQLSIDERIELLPGVSPHGYMYRLSNVFDQYPRAKVGVSQLELSVLGYHKFRLNCDIEARHLPVLHWFVPNMEFFVPKSNLQQPNFDTFSIFYKRHKNRWTFLISRFLFML